MDARNACLKYLPALLLGLMLLSGDARSADGLTGFELRDWQQEVRDWQHNRLSRLTRPDGWLSLVAFEWLPQGSSEIGSGDDVDIRIPGGPDYWGTISVQGDRVAFLPADEGGVLINGEKQPLAQLVADHQGKATVVSAGSTNFYVIMREELAIRAKDSQSPVRTEFRGLDYYPINRDWRKVARYEPHPPGTTIDVANVLGQIIPTPNPGALVFEHEGQEYRVEGLVEEGSDQLFFVISDRTSGNETYGAGRTLYADYPGLDGTTVIDFNKAYNPPCAFTEFSTCQLPPPGNRLDVVIDAGELKYEHDS